MHDVEFLIDPAGAAFEKAAKSSALPAEGIRSMRGRFIIVRHMEYVTESRARRKAFRLRIVIAAAVEVRPGIAIPEALQIERVG